jgi:RNA recognition motif-containing protein
VKKIFIGQLPTDFVEQDLSDYFSQFGIIDTIELVNLILIFFSKHDIKGVFKCTVPSVTDRNRLEFKISVFHIVSLHRVSHF